MTETTKRKKSEPTPRQIEIKRLVDKGSKKRTDQESARLDQLKKEERRERFLRLAPFRVQRAMKMLATVANLGNKSNYDYTAEEAAKINAALASSLDAVMDAFSERRREESMFTL